MKITRDNNLNLKEATGEFKKKEFNENILTYKSNLKVNDGYIRWYMDLPEGEVID